MIYTVKNVKNFQGREGYGFECSLYKDGKKIGTVTDTANGGMIDFYLNKGEKEILDTYCKTIPNEPYEQGISITEKQFNQIYPHGRPTDCDIFLYNLVDGFEKMKKYRKWCKKDTVYRIETDDKGFYRTIKKPYDNWMREYLKKRYKGQGLIVVNELIKN